MLKKIKRASVICGTTLSGLIYVVRIPKGGGEETNYLIKMAKNNPNLLKL